MPYVPLAQVRIPGSWDGAQGPAPGSAGSQLLLLSLLPPPPHPQLILSSSLSNKILKKKNQFTTKGFEAENLKEQNNPEQTKTLKTGIFACEILC